MNEPTCAALPVLHAHRRHGTLQGDGTRSIKRSQTTPTAPNNLLQNVAGLVLWAVGVPPDQDTLRRAYEYDTITDEGREAPGSAQARARGQSHLVNQVPLFTPPARTSEASCALLAALATCLAPRTDGGMNTLPAEKGTRHVLPLTLWLSDSRIPTLSPGIQLWRPLAGLPECLSGLCGY